MTTLEQELLEALKNILAQADIFQSTVPGGATRPLDSAMADAYLLTEKIQNQQTEQPCSDH